MRKQSRALRDIASKNRANNEAQCKTGGWGEEQNERENNGKAKCSYDEIGDQKTSRENGSRRCNENNRFPPRASKDIARVH